MDEPGFEWVLRPAPSSDRSPERPLAHAQQEAVRSQVKNLVSADLMKSYRKLRVSYTLRDTAIIYSIFAGAVIGTCWLHAAWGPRALAAAPFLALATGVGFNWINVQVHEASHCLLLRRKRWNDLYCNLLLGAFGLQDVETYRATHRMHHAHLHTRLDPDLWVYTSNVGCLRHVAQGILEDLSLLTIFRRKKQVAEFVEATGVSRQAPWYLPFAKLLAQCLVLGAFVAGCGVWGIAYYLVVYLYGLIGVFPVLVRVRTVVQHFDASLLSAPQGTPLPFVSRSTVAPIFEFVLIGARMDYHFEHHVYPGLPYYGLKMMHQMLLSRGFFDSPRDKPGPKLHTDNYLQTYLSLTSTGA